MPIERNDAGESSTAIYKRMNDAAWPLVQDALRAGAVLQRPSRMRDFYTYGLQPPDRRNGVLLTAGRVRQLELKGVLKRVGVDTYTLAELA